jgi:hypothetical protein
MNVTRSDVGELDIVSTFLPAEETPIAEHREALRIWNEKRGDRLAPAWREVELTDFPLSLLRYTAVTDLTENPLGSTYRYWGSELTEIYGHDYTGRSPSDVPPKTIGFNNQGGCARILRDRAPHFLAREYMNHNGFLGRALILRVPLSDDGVHVNHSITFFHYESSGGDHAEFFKRLFAGLD